jgi:hypothetical protein
MSINFGTKAGDGYKAHLGPDSGLVSTPVTGTVLAEKGSKSKGFSVYKNSEETINKGVLTSEAELIMMEVGGGRTVNLGNFESARIDVHLKIPSTMETMEETYEFATKWVGDKIKEAVDGAKG